MSGEDATGYPDVDAVLTTREMAQMIKEAGIDFVNLPDEDFDPVLGTSTGAGVIFGATGGVMEAALRTVAEVLTGEELKSIDFCDVRGIAGIKEAEIMVGDMPVKVAVASGTGNARKLLEAVRSGEKEYHFIEIMACPGGCVNGGGQPIVSARIKNVLDPRVVRAQGLYDEDCDKPLTSRTSDKRSTLFLCTDVGSGGRTQAEFLVQHRQQVWCQETRCSRAGVKRARLPIPPPGHR